MSWKAAIATLFCVAFSVVSNAQICNGNLGNNIFPEGDFGSGVAPILSSNPNIAPGYDYNTNAPLDDGQYVLVNHVTAISDDWLPVGDNSPDPDGYIMVVNASFDPGLFYEQTVTGICENTTYVFSADVINLINDDGYLTPNVSFLIDGVVQYSSGEVPPNSQWMNYGFSFTTDPGQTSITLGLRNNAPGGQGNDLAIDNISFRPCGPEAVISPNFIPVLCEDGTSIDLEAVLTGGNYNTPFVQWQVSTDGGQTWSDIQGANAMTYTHTNLSGGTYIYRFLLANGLQAVNSPFCREVSDERVVEVTPKFYTVIDSICDGLSVQFGSDEIGVTGSYTDSLVSQNGCDSIVTLQLTIVPNELSAAVQTQDPSCFQYSDGTINIIANSPNGGPYQHALNGSLSNSNGVFNGLTAGGYNFEIEDRFGCKYSNTTELFNPIEFIVSIDPDTAVDLGQSFPISLVSNESIDQFTWSDGVDCERGCSNPTWFPSDTGWLILEATTEDGCVATDSLYANVEKVRYLFFPNAFTPNGDGRNDRFYPIGPFPNAYYAESFQVFNKWGELIHHGSFSMAENEQNGWDGTMRGKPVESGVYAYRILIRFLDGVVQDYSGTVTVVR